MQKKEVPWTKKTLNRETWSFQEEKGKEYTYEL